MAHIVQMLAWPALFFLSYYTRMYTEQVYLVNPMDEVEFSIEQ